MPIEFNNRNISPFKPFAGNDHQDMDSSIKGTKKDTTTPANADSVSITNDYTELQKNILQLPTIDLDRVAELRKKINSGELEILSNSKEKRLASAEKIVDNMLAFDSMLPDEENS